MNIIEIIGIIAVIANLLLAIILYRWKILSPDVRFKDVKRPLFVAFLCLLALFLHNIISLIIIPIALAFELHFLNYISLYKRLIEQIKGSPVENAIRDSIILLTLYRQKRILVSQYDLKELKHNLTLGNKVQKKRANQFAYRMLNDFVTDDFIKVVQKQLDKSKQAYLDKYKRNKNS